MEKIKIGITGHDGFIGINLIKKLEKNSDLTLAYFSGDLLKKEDIESFFQNNPEMDQIIHLAGTFLGDFNSLLKINVEATFNLLEAANKHKVKKIIFTSSGAVYGEPVGQESLEDDPKDPNTNYGLAKKIAEDIVLYFSRNFGMDYVILRYPNVYGEGNEKGVIYNFLNDIEEKGKVILHGDGTQSRNFLHVKDAVAAIEKSIFYEKSDIFNISNPVKTSLNDLVAIFQKKYQFDIERKEANNNLKDLLLNIDKAREKLKFEPEVKEISI